MNGMGKPFEKKTDDKKKQKGGGVGGGVGGGGGGGGGGCGGGGDKWRGRWKCGRYNVGICILKIRLVGEAYLGRYLYFKRKLEDKGNV